MDIIASTETSELTQISSLVSVAFDTIDLPHNVISQDVFLGDANLYIKREIPGWENLTGDDETYLKILVKKKTAVNILTAYARVQSETADVTVSRVQLTPTEAIDQYEEDISEGIKILNPESLNTGGRHIVAAVVI